MLMKLCGFSRVPHNFFFIKKHIRYFIYHFFEIILMIVNGTSSYVFQVRVDTITFPFYYECNFFLLSIYLFSDYFSGIFFHFFCKGILSLSFINYRFIYISMFTQARQTSQLTVLSLKNENIIIGIVWSWGIGLLCIAFQVN